MMKSDISTKGLLHCMFTVLLDFLIPHGMWLLILVLLSYLLLPNQLFWEPANMQKISVWFVFIHQPSLLHVHNYEIDQNNTRFTTNFSKEMTTTAYFEKTSCPFAWWSNWELVGGCLLVFSSPLVISLLIPGSSPAPSASLNLSKSRKWPS